jgi:hypothetical protein
LPSIHGQIVQLAGTGTGNHLNNSNYDDQLHQVQEISIEDYLFIDVFTDFIMENLPFKYNSSSFTPSASSLLVRDTVGLGNNVLLMRDAVFVY